MCSSETRHPFASGIDGKLAEAAAAFIATHGRRPLIEDIDADPQWSALFTEKKTGEREAAGEPPPGGCTVYIVRRRRFCSHAAADGLGGLCSEHYSHTVAGEATTSAPPLLPSRVQEGEGQARPGGSKKTNLRRRMKRMTNPLAHQFRTSSAAAPTLDSLFADPALPLLLDVGCAKGRWLGALASDAVFQKQFGAHNFAGLEIFEPLVTAANAWRDAAGLRNLAFLGGAAASVLPLLNVPTLCRVCVQFPDPWRDDNAAKRVLTPSLATWLAATLPAGGEVFLVSDVRWLALEMRTTVMATVRRMLERQGLAGSTDLI